MTTSDTTQTLQEHKPKGLRRLSSKAKAGLGIGAVLGGALVAFLAFGVFGIHTLFIDETVNEANPFAAAAVAVEQVETISVVDSSDTDASTSTVAPAAGDSATAETAAAAPAAAEAAETAAPAATNQVITLGTGQLVDHDHSGDGTVNVITNGEQTFLRFEDDFAVDNGPDLNVYLVRGADANGDAGLFDDDFIDLGDLKGNIGAQNYELPEGIDITEYDTVVIWCVRFGVAFNAANIA